MNGRLAATLGASLAGLAVGLGAFGAHALRARVDARMLEVFETAVRYQMYHALGLLAVAYYLGQEAPGAGGAAWSFLVGILLFSGSLYLMVATGHRWLGAVTPLGGVAFMLGWALLALAAWRSS
ncbi:MAG: DUF423 domain-containing protein [Gemmatimonadales bacterium]|nr:DUF423 domain-containing protein [Gemmatimonadales bacterium]